MQDRVPLIDETKQVKPVNGGIAEVPHMNFNSVVTAQSTMRKFENEVRNGERVIAQACVKCSLSGYAGDFSIRSYIYI